MSDRPLAGTRSSAPRSFMERLRAPRLRRLQRGLFFMILLSSALLYLIKRL